MLHPTVLAKQNKVKNVKIMRTGMGRHTAPSQARHKTTIMIMQLILMNHFMDMLELEYILITLAMLAKVMKKLTKHILILTLNLARV